MDAENCKHPLPFQRRMIYNMSTALSLWIWRHCLGPILRKTTYRNLIRNI